MTNTFERDDEPSDLEKTNQLELILLSSTFERLEKPAKVLRRLVYDALAGILPEEHQLGIDLFERKPNWVTDEANVVRQNMTRLRKLLQSYYADEGIEDRLNLELLGYKAIFSYNPRHPFERIFRPALRRVATDPQVAFTLLDEALGLKPDHAEALAARGETELWRPLIGNELPIPDLLAAAEEQARQALNYDPDCWRAHVVLGAVHSCRRDWTAAEQSFAAAHASSPHKTQVHPWYAGFLIATGRTDEALNLTKARASAPSNSPWPLLTYALFLYAARRFDEAKSLVLEAGGRHEDTWLAHVIWSCVLSAQGRQKSNVPLLGMSMLQSLPDGTVVYTALSLLENVQRLNPGDPDHDAVKEMTLQWLSVKEAARSAAEENDEPPPFTEIRVSPFQLAIGYMALGERTRAVELLGQDLQRGHPLMVWLHLWPLFDSLRDVPEFARLIRRMKLPAR